jgi:hypothetical protein
VETLAGFEDVALDDGALRFRIPAGWTHGREADGGAAFYDGALDRGTLRVKLMTFTSDDDLTEKVALDQLAGIEEEPGQKLEALANGNALRTHREQAEAGGEGTVVHVWLLASIDPPHKMRLAVFSFTVAARDAGEAAMTKLVAALDREIRRARFAHQLS